MAAEEVKEEESLVESANSSPISTQKGAGEGARCRIREQICRSLARSREWPQGMPANIPMKMLNFKLGTKIGKIGTGFLLLS